ncbi:protein PYRICULARIA ORYZAE RESISTANCE 21-like [Lycium barbarum]|uniref:protein PYRICULARIA ORYZAE RESISTANCE 21-like n=1 Tax=Lycium barbarum TaxID=112863 RepID=UPI00293F799B|nr:protein PYRICULARIA ORYZAE RESISTANCE 21-like [Lycium barbarum]
MGGEKTGKPTIMVLKVDLQCCNCYTKVKKILCKFPQIRDQVYDEKANTVTITVVCCNPEKLRDKLCCKGCGVIKSIEIKEPEKRKQLEKLKELEKTIDPKKVVENVTKVIPPVPPGYCCGECYEGYTGGPCYHSHGRHVAPPPGYCCGQCYEGSTGGPCYHSHGRSVPPPSGYCCGECYEGSTRGPCYQSYGRPVPPPPCYDNYGPGPYGYRRVSRCDEYFYEENATGCSIM